jgi:hypothetical protein
MKVQKKTVNLAISAAIGLAVTFVLAPGALPAVSLLAGFASFSLLAYLTWV